MTPRDPAFSFGFPAIPLLARFAFAASAWIVPVCMLGGWRAVAVFTVLSVPVLVLSRHYTHSRIGLCNFLTFGRLAFASVLVSRLGQEVGWSEVWLALAALATDGIDGWAARRAGLVSRFGARFDMEVDLFLALILACLAMERLGVWVLALGLMRYVWLGAGVVLPWLMGPLPDRLSRKVVCVVQISALVVVICPAVPLSIATPVAIAAGLALVWSFGIDLLWRARQG